MIQEKQAEEQEWEQAAGAAAAAVHSSRAVVEKAGLHRPSSVLCEETNEITDQNVHRTLGNCKLQRVQLIIGQAYLMKLSDTNCLDCTDSRGILLVMNLNKGI